MDGPVASTSKVLWKGKGKGKGRDAGRDQSLLSNSNRSLPKQDDVSFPRWLSLSLSVH